MAKQHILVFFVGKDRFAIDTQDVIEILPMVNITHIPKTEDYISGMMNFRGSMMPVIDLCMLLNKRPSQEKICTRIITIRNQYSREFDYTGLIAEKVSRTMHLDTSNIIKHKLTNKKNRYLGKIIQDNSNEIQIIDLDKLLPTEVNNQHLEQITG